MFQKSVPTLSLALQGGGAHGAFTWGVLDALLEDGRIQFDGISGTSAGAMNAVILAHGLLHGGRDGAREALAYFWQSVISLSARPSIPFSTEGAPSGMSSSSVRMALSWMHHLSPQQLNPFDLDPLRDILEKQVDFASLRTASPVKLFIAATHTNTGKLRLFETTELDTSAVLASACLPTLRRTVEVDGEPYWDGAYSANPAIFPLLHDCHASDILLVLLNPLLSAKTPSSVEEIRARSIDLAFKASFLSEMRIYAEVNRHAQQSQFPLNWFGKRLRNIYFHMIEAEDVLSKLSSESRIIPESGVFDTLFEQGRNHASEWLSQHFSSIGQSSSIDLTALFG